VDGKEMKTITLKIEDAVWQTLLAQKKLIEFLDGCVHEPSIFEKIMLRAIEKIEKGEGEITVGEKR
jgi:hypothetical protein